MIKSPKLLLEFKSFGKDIDFLLRKEDGNDIYDANVEWVKVKDVGLVPEPTFSISLEEGAALMEKLWRLGFRPQDIRHEGLKVEAMKEHISDLQKIIDKFISILPDNLISHRSG